MEFLNRRTVLKSAAALAIACCLLPGLASAAASSCELITSDEAGILVDSTVIMGKKSAALVDAQFTAGNVALVADMISASGRTPESILIIHIDTHPWTEEVATTGTAGWRTSVEALRDIGSKTVFPGHRNLGSPNEGTLFDVTIADLDHCEKARADSANAEEFRAKLLVGTENSCFAFAMDPSVAEAFPG